MVREIVLALLAMIFICMPVSVSAQDNNGGTYFKVDFIKAADSIQDISSSPDSLTIEVESYFRHSKVLLSGWSLAYKKEDIHFIDSGHYFSLSTFRTFGPRFLSIKLKGGAEWGYPSLLYEKTIFIYDPPGQLKSYQHSFLVRNSGIPRFGSKHDGTFYPLSSLSLVSRSKVFLVEGGVRMDFRKFSVNDYGPGLQFATSQKWIVSPSVFIGFGLRLF